jgi:hypothetical protein
MTKRTFGDRHKQSSKALRIRTVQLAKYLLEDSQPSQHNNISPNRWLDESVELGKKVPRLGSRGWIR